MSAADVLIHPTRLRIIQALSGGQRLTTRELFAVLADVPLASLYRHVGRLAAAGVLRVAVERVENRPRERVYELVESATNVGPEAYRGVRPELYLRHFSAFVATLLADFRRYLARFAAPDPGRDGVAFYRFTLQLDDDEARRLTAELAEAIASARAKPASPERRERLVSVVLLPGEPAHPLVEPRPGRAGPIARLTKRDPHRGEVTPP